MAPIRIQHVVSFTSQDPKNRVENVCEPTGASNPWLCGKQECSRVLKAELQLERASNICFIDVGNFGSAFIQVDVGRSSWSSDHTYVTLLPTAALMSPADSRQGKGRQCVRMFKKADFLPQAAEESWDRLRITCTQPFNKQCQFGLSFLRLRTAEEHTDEVSVLEDTEKQGTPEKIQLVRDWLTSPAVQHTFFGKTEQSSPGDDQSNHRSLSRAERMVTAAQSTRRSLHIESCDTLTSTPIQRVSKNQNTQLDKASTSRECRGKSKPRKAQASTMSALKRSRPAGCENLTLKCSKTSTPTRTGTENLNPNPVNTHIPAVSPTYIFPDSSEPPESICPICGVSFSIDYLPLHASSCLDSASTGFSGNVRTDIMTSLDSPPPFIRDDFMMPCPLCSLMFPIDCIEQHASTCGDTVWLD